MTKTNNDLLPLLVPISSIHEDPDNARTHDERNLAAITASLSEFGQQKPIVVDSNHCVIAGNGTLAAAKILGWSQIAVTRTSLSDENARRAYAVADNRTAELAGWDLSILSETLFTLSQFDNLSTATGFDENETASMIARSGREVSGAPDYGALDEHDVSDQVESLTDGAKKAILIEFDMGDYDEAYKLINYWRKNGVNIGSVLLNSLRSKGNVNI